MQRIGDPRAASYTVTVVAGDFNWTTDPDGRLNLKDCETVHVPDHEESHWKSCTARVELPKWV